MWQIALFPAAVNGEKRASRACFFRPVRAVCAADQRATGRKKWFAGTTLDARFSECMICSPVYLMPSTLTTKSSAGNSQSLTVLIAVGIGGEENVVRTGAGRAARNHVDLIGLGGRNHRIVLILLIDDQSLDYVILDTPTWLPPGRDV